MKVLKKSVVAVAIILFGIGCFMLALFFSSSASGNYSESYAVCGITGVEGLKTKFYVNEPLSFDSAKICLKTDDSALSAVHLEASYISGFDTRKQGEFTMTVKYQGFYYEIPYSVTYKKIAFQTQDTLEFELDEEIDKNQYFVYAYDFYDNVVAQKTLEEVSVSNLSTQELTANEKNGVRTAQIEVFGKRTSFDYRVFYFSSKANYTGVSEPCEDGCEYQVLQFNPSVDGHIKIARKVAKYGFVEEIFEYDLLRIDESDCAMFMTSKTIARFLYQDKTLVLFKNVASNQEKIEIKLSKSSVEENPLPSVVKILEVENVKQNFLVGEKVEIENAKIVLLLSDKTLMKVDVDGTNFENLKTDEVGNFVAKVQFFKFVFEFSYSVNFCAVKFYFEDASASQDVFTFEVASKNILDFKLIFFNAEGEIVGFRFVKDEDVKLLNFDTTTPSEGQKRVASIVCHGARLDFEYLVIQD